MIPGPPAQDEKPAPCGMCGTGIVPRLLLSGRVSHGGEWALLAPAADHSRFAGLDHPLSGGGGSAVFPGVPCHHHASFQAQHPLCAALLRQYLHPLPALRQQGSRHRSTTCSSPSISAWASAATSAGRCPALGWIILGLCTVFFVVLGSYNLVRYTQLTYDDTRQDMILKRKFDAAGTGVSVFVHGVKNQLLSSRVLHKKLSRALAGDPPDMAQVRACAVSSTS